MLVEFSVANFRSIKKKQTLSLLAAPIVSKDESIDENNVFEAPNGIKLLKTLAVYGANASGKSNLVKALLRMIHFIAKSFQDENQVERFETFQLDHNSSKKPIHFEMIFIVKKSLYRYGFEITNRRVSAEWLFGPAKKNEVEYFTRQLDDISINKTSFKEGEGLTEGKTRSSTLFLNVVHAFNGSISKEIRDSLLNSFAVTSGIDDSRFRIVTTTMLDRAEYDSQIMKLLKDADFGIEALSVVDVEDKEIPSDISPEVKKKIGAGQKLQAIMTLKQSKGLKSAQPLAFRFDQFESEGTKKFFSYVGPIIQTLANGTCLIIDEFDARLHPSLTHRIVEMFNSNEYNKNNAQLIFVTHDTNFLDSSLMRRDQIYFAEKNKAGETSFYSLINIGGVRNDASFEKDYIKGKYGAIPFLGDFKIE